MKNNCRSGGINVTVAERDEGHPKPVGPGGQMQADCSGEYLVCRAPARSPGAHGRASFRPPGAPHHLTLHEVYPTRLSVPTDPGRPKPPDMRTFGSRNLDNWGSAAQNFPVGGPWILPPDMPRMDPVHFNK